VEADCNCGGGDGGGLRGIYKIVLVAVVAGGVMLVETRKLWW